MNRAADPEDVPGLPPEFGFIRRNFLPLAGAAALGLSDDAAVFSPPPGREIVAAADAMVAGVHFLPDDPPETVGAKLLRVNLSDLAAMGAVPLGYLLTLSVPPDLEPGWFEAFAAGLAADQRRFELSLLGGDTTATTGGPLVLSLSILGTVPPRQALRRNGARAGDGIWVSGTIGDGALGLDVLQGRAQDPTGWLAERYRRPSPRTGLGWRLLGVASAAMDVSDGLLQDLGHLCRASGVSALVDADGVPASPAAAAFGDASLERRLTGGDDYELLFAVPPEREGELASAAAEAGVPVTRIGRFEAGPPTVTARHSDGTLLRPARLGWSHF
ncbi:thiamine-phosphate kinase [Rhizosaccharibacter radicis]|uniref:Thiamine-monophosphate kinase n=1 Tax=Rhizosaccharibacter radicis TaxID=2782605 RepID=A0ABT1VY76_9PROT|nr:thiamine-phosphate kinase [Acetobacteraceae bacterium KSS12]